MPYLIASIFFILLLVPSEWGHFILGASAALVYLFLFSKGKIQMIRSDWILWVLWGYFLSGVFFLVPSFERGIAALVDFTSCLFLFFSVRSMDLSLEKWAKPLFVVSGISALWGLVGLGLSDHWGYLRTFSFWGSHAHWASFLIFIIPIAMFWVMRGGRRWGILFLAILFANYYFTFSRSSFLALGLCMGVLLLMRKGDKQQIPLNPPLTGGRLLPPLSRGGLGRGWLLAVFLILSLSLYKIHDAQKSGVRLSFLSLQPIVVSIDKSIPELASGIDFFFEPIPPRNAVSFRLSYWKHASEIFRDHWFWGIGIGAFADQYRLYYQDLRDFSGDPHSWPLSLALAGGVAGGVILFIWIISVVRTRFWEGWGDSQKILALSLGLLLVSNLWDRGLIFLPHLLMIFVSLGMLLGDAGRPGRDTFGRRGTLQRAPTGPVVGISIILLFVSSSFFLSSLFSNPRLAYYFYRPRSEYAYAEAQKHVDGEVRADYFVWMSRALFWDAPNYIYRTQLAVNLWNTGRHSEALSEIERTIASSPRGIPNLYLYYFQLLKNRGEYEKIVRVGETVILDYPRDILVSEDYFLFDGGIEKRKSVADIYGWMARAAETLGDFGKAQFFEERSRFILGL
ncbi:MAG: hypothetical protein G01um101418_407 [Parcubacteria group bacterium Gr01-1014_18]|nr:MAG: hypothetical protein Greene041636_347 [Parcubacteria group bacterium Greene0416_36]TSC81128.1 MAG: hypothetical protein G01um101418_407 [Parcubacteria group bacterium Gr01-1014_18]TSC98455.1 MAG: hypothetical protein Greene101420_692 [Parcubacteria group bacterium Greene1014_20]TSD07379.1 MAG: hypothetical protein Greene07142_234 [Parcubacteria group bacterium Greene0714_2]